VSFDELSAPRSRRGAVLAYALNRWQTIVVLLVACLGIAGTIAFLDTYLPLIVVWLAFAVLGTGAMVVVSFRDAASVDEALTSQVDLGELRDRALREKVARAEAYQRSIRQAVRQIRSPELRSSLELITREIADPVGLIFTLAKRLEGYQADALLQQDLRRLGGSRPSLTAPEQEQLGNLEKLQRLMSDTAGAIDNALAQLGASYSAVQLARSAGELKGSSAQQALSDLRLQSQQLRDLNTSLDEVYGGKSGA